MSETKVYYHKTISTNKHLVVGWPYLAPLGISLYGKARGSEGRGRRRKKATPYEG